MGKKSKHRWEYDPKADKGLDPLIRPHEEVLLDEATIRAHPCGCTGGTRTASGTLSL